MVNPFVAVNSAVQILCRTINFDLTGEDCADLRNSRDMVAGLSIHNLSVHLDHIPR